MLRRFQNPHQKPVRLFHPGDPEHGQPTVELVAAAGEIFEMELPEDQPRPDVLNELTPGRESAPWDVAWTLPEPVPAATNRGRFARSPVEAPPAEPAAAETAPQES
jgi:hypothetical protein